MAAKKTGSAKKKSTRKRPGADKKAAGKKKSAARKKSVPRKAAGSQDLLKFDRVAEIQRVIDVMIEAGAVEIELEERGTKLRVRLKEDIAMPVLPYAAAPSPAGTTPIAPGALSPSGAPAPADDPKRFIFTSPMVGTFYRAASPEAEAFVEVGDAVTQDTTMCILEAMKVMNEIKAEVEGEILEILAQTGEPVEFGQPLFVIKTP